MYCTKTTSVLLAAVSLPIHIATAAIAQPAWPTREIRLIVPFVAGSGTDFVARLMAERLREVWKQPVVLENIPGSSGTIGVTKLARSAADGYTLVLSGDAAIVVAISMFRSLAYDPTKDLVPIIQIGRTPNVLVVNAARGPGSLQDLVAVAKDKPGTITFNSAGFGTSQHMGFEQLKRMAGVEILHVPSRTSTVPDILGGHVTASFMNILVALPHVREGTMKALAVSGSARASAAPNVLTVAEQGYPDFNAVAWFGILSPAGTPNEIVRKVHSDVAKVLSDPEFKSRVTQFGLELEEHSTPETFAAFIKQEIPRIGEIVKASGIKLDQ